MTAGRILGIDHGDARIGVALSDPTGVLASPLCVIPGAKTALDEVAALAREHGVTAVVVGLPRNMDGSYGPAAEKVRAFMDQLRVKIGVPVLEWDERLSTVSAHNALREAGLDGRKRKGLVDKVAAQIILQNYLDARTDM